MANGPGDSDTNERSTNERSIGGGNIAAGSTHGEVPAHTGIQAQADTHPATFTDLIDHFRRIVDKLPNQQDKKKGSKVSFFSLKKYCNKSRFYKIVQALQALQLF